MSVQGQMRLDLQKIYSLRRIGEDEICTYTVMIPCVNRTERGAINVIDKTFDNFEENGYFDEIQNVNIQFYLLESGSKDLSYLAALKPYLDKYPNKIKLVLSKEPLDGPKNILRIFQIVNKYVYDPNHFIIWMDDDILICKNFLKNCDHWIREYMNYTLFGSLYSPYHSFDNNPNFFNCKKSYIRSYHGSCCTIFKPILAKYIIPLWFKTNMLRNVTEPDLRYRESIMKFFPHIQFFLVSYPSLVEHLNIGSAIYQHKQIKKGHHARIFMGIDKDPMWYRREEELLEDNNNSEVKKNIKMEVVEDQKSKFEPSTAINPDTP